MNYGKRLKSARKNKGLSQEALAKISGVKQGSISKIERGDQSSSTFDIELAEALGVHALWLKTGDIKKQPNWLYQVAPEKTTLNEKSIKLDSNHYIPHHNNIEPGPNITSSVPLISWIQAGAWQEIIDNLHPGDAEEWIDTTAKVSEQSFALRIKGDSMTNPHGSPSLPEGSLAIIDPNAHCDNGNIVVARLEDSMEATIKKLVIDGGQRYLKPLNPAYPTIPINGNCHIIGRAVRVELDL